MIRRPAYGLRQQVGGSGGDDADRCDLEHSFDQGLAGDFAFDIAEYDQGQNGDDTGYVEPGFATVRPSDMPMMMSRTGSEWEEGGSLVI